MTREASNRHISTTPLTIGSLQQLWMEGILAKALNENPHKANKLTIVASSNPDIIKAAPAQIYSTLAQESFWAGSVLTIHYNNIPELEKVLSTITKVMDKDKSITNFMLRDHGNDSCLGPIDIDNIKASKVDFLGWMLPPGCTFVLDGCSTGQHFAQSFAERFDLFKVSAPNFDISLYPNLWENIFTNIDWSIVFNPGAYDLLKNSQYTQLQLWTAEKSEVNLKQKPDLFTATDTPIENYFFQYGNL